MNRRIGMWGRMLAPGYSCCFYCGTPWKFITPHVTNYEPGSGCLPLCEKCWSELKTPEARLPYYEMLWARWKAQGTSKPDEEWDRIEAAVMAERANA